MSIYVAYNSYGDLIAAEDSYADLMLAVEAAGYWPEEVIVGRVTP